MNKATTTPSPMRGTTGAGWLAAATALVTLQVGAVVLATTDSESAATQPTAVAASQVASPGTDGERSWLEPILPAAEASVGDMAQVRDIAFDPQDIFPAGDDALAIYAIESAAEDPSLMVAAALTTLNTARGASRDAQVPLPAAVSVGGQAAIPAVQPATPATGMPLEHNPRPRLRPASLPRRESAPGRTRTWTPARWLQERSPDHLTLQLAALSERAGQRRFINEHRLGKEAVALPLVKLGTRRHVVLYGSYPDRLSAERAARRLAARHGVKPWIRRMADVQRELPTDLRTASR